MKKIILSIFLISLLLSPYKLKAEIVNLYGFKPASIDSLPIFQSTTKLFQTEEIVQVSFLAEIDKKGNLKSLKCQNEIDVYFLSYIESYLKKLTFNPAVYNGKNIKSILPFDVIFAKKIYSPQFSFPLKQDTLIKDNDLFEYTLKLNKITHPQIISFPSYFFGKNNADTSNRYPFTIQKIQYEDSTIKSIENYFSTTDLFLQQIQSAILYADIKQAKFKDKKLQSDVYLMVSFFPQISYPVSAYDGNFYDSTNFLRNKRVQLINKFSTYLSEPLPKSSSANIYSLNSIDATFLNPINSIIKIDTLGQAKAQLIGTSNKKLAKSISLIISRLKFYPALNQQNQLVEFNGIIRFEAFDELNIRISYLWMNHY